MRFTEAVERILSLVLAWVVALILASLVCDIDWTWVVGSKLSGFVRRPDSPQAIQVLTALSGLCALMGLMIAGELARRLRRQELWCMDTEHGRIAISCQAVRQLIAHYCGALPIIVEAKPSVEVVRGRLRVRCRVKALQADKSTTSAICQRVQAAIKECITDVLGISEVASIHVTVSQVELQRPVQASAPSQNLSAEDRGADARGKLSAAIEPENRGGIREDPIPSKDH